MRPSLTLILLSIACLTGCQDKSSTNVVYAERNKDEIPIYRLAIGDSFELKIDDEYHYKTGYRVLGGPPMGKKVGVIKRSPGLMSTIYLRVDGRDTSFKMPLYRYDSIMFGAHGHGEFLIDTIFDANEWGLD